MPAELRGAFVAARVDAASSPDLLMMFHRAGFYCVDNEITLKYVSAVGPQRAHNPGVRVEEFHKNENLPYDRLGGVFSLTRFHYDPHVGKTQADHLWSEYIRNYRPSPEARLFVAICDEEVAGCFTVSVRGPAHILSFVSVLDKFRGRAVGSSLLQAVVSACGGSNLLTETQSRNLAAVNFYIKNGFRRIEKTSVVMHRWDQ